MAAAAAAVALLVSLLLLIITVLKGCCSVIWFYWLTPRRIKKAMERQGVSGPKPGFLVGNILHTAAMVAESTADDMDSIRHDIVPRLLPHYVAWSKQYGKRFIYWNGVEPRMCLAEIDLVKELLTKYNSVSGKSWLQQQGSKHFIGRGLLMANGTDWHHQRHIVAPAFIGDKLKSYVGNMVESTERMIESLERATVFGQTEFEIGGYMARLTAEIISQTEFGNNYEKGKQIFHLLTLLQHRCAQASRYLWLPASRFFPSKYNRDIKLLKSEVETLLMGIIQSRKESVEFGRISSYGNDLLGMLLTEMKKKKKKKKKGLESDGLFDLNMQLVMDECKTFFFAGHETTALLLTWSIMLLASNPTWQEKVRSEVRQVCNANPPSADHLSKLNLLNMVINESLRLYPPASILPRMAFEDFKLGDDLHIPKGLSIWVPVLAIHHNKEIWGEDADEFNPEHFATKSFSGPGRNFLPFAAGPRNCVGQSFALMEAKIILAMLISKFRFEISPSYRHAPVIVLTIKPKHGVQVILKPLKDAYIRNDSTFGS